MKSVNQFGSAEPGHLQVGKDHGRLDGFQGFQGGGAVAHGFNLESAFFQNATHGMPNEHGISNNQGK